MTCTTLIGSVAIFAVVNFLAADLSSLMARILDCPGPGCPADPETSASVREELEQELRSLQAQQSEIEDELNELGQRIKSIAKKPIWGLQKNKEEAAILEELLQRRDVLEQQQTQVLGEIGEVQKALIRLPQSM